jgi:ribose-phosphate pyrophosphokinase
MRREPMIFALGATRSLGERVATRLGVQCAALEERDFEDGEHKTRALCSVRGRDVFVIHSLYGDPRQSVDDKLCRLLFFIGALKDSSAARVTAVAPYLAHARKDRKTQPRDPVTTRYVACLFEAVGTDRVVTIDVHNLAAYQNAFRCVTENLEARKLFVAHFAAGLGDEQVVVVSPDAGGVKRADHFRTSLADALGRPVGAAFAEKHRAGGVVRGEALVGEVDGRVAIIVDDLISSGGTIARTAANCRAHGARAVHAVATHGLFMQGADAALSDPALDRIVVTDTVEPFRIESAQLRAKLTVLPIDALVADAIGRLHRHESITDLLAG